MSFFSNHSFLFVSRCSWGRCCCLCLCLSVTLCGRSSRASDSCCSGGWETTGRSGRSAKNSGWFAAGSLIDWRIYIYEWYGMHGSRDMPWGLTLWWMDTHLREEGGKAPFVPIFLTSRKNAGHDLAFAFAFSGRNTVAVLPMRSGMAKDRATPPCLAYCIIHLTCRCLLNAECIQSVTPTNILCSLYCNISRCISDISRKNSMLPFCVNCSCSAFHLHFYGF